MGACPAELELERLAEGMLEPAAAGMVRAHVERCERCRGAFDKACENARLLTDIRRIVGDAAQSMAPRTAERSLEGAGDVTVRVAGYELVRLIGEGATAAVYEAYQPLPGRAVAIKLLRNWECAFSARKELFAREASALGRLSHPGIEAVYATGLTEAGQPFIAMELVRGAALHVHWRDAKLDRRSRVALLVEVCDAVQHAHDRGVLHRDLKPSNVMVDEAGHIKVLDFGLARISGAAASSETVPAEESTTLYSGAGGLLGTLAFMAPEQVRGNAAAIDHRCDVYALGAMLYLALTDQLPVSLTGLSVREAAAAVCEHVPPAPSRVRADVPAALNGVVARTLAKRPEDRYGRVGDLAEDLRRWLDGGMPTPQTRHGRIAGVVAGLLVMVACAAWWWPRSGTGASEERDVSRRSDGLEMALLPEWTVTGDLDDELVALDELFKAAATDEDRRDVHIRRGLIHEVRHEDEAAMGEYSAAAALSGETAHPHEFCGMARAMAELGRFEESERALERVRERMMRGPPGSHVSARYELAESSALLYKRMGRDSDAARHIEQSRRLAEQMHGPGEIRWARWLAERVDRPSMNGAQSTDPHQPVLTGGH